MSDISLRILVIDDDAVMRELLPALLALFGHEVECFADGRRGLERLADTASPHVDVVLTDVHMPGMGGQELARTIRRQKTYDVRLIGMSGSEATESELDAFDAFLLKPFTPDALAELLATSGSRARADDAALPRFTVLDEDVLRRLEQSLSSAQVRAFYGMAIDDAADRVARICSTHATGDDAAVRLEAHALKGGSAMMGAVELAAMSADVEEHGLHAKVTAGDFMEAIEHLRRMLVERLPASE